MYDEMLHDQLSNCRISVYSPSFAKQKKNPLVRLVAPFKFFPENMRTKKRFCFPKNYAEKIGSRIAVHTHMDNSVRGGEEGAATNSFPYDGKSNENMNKTGDHGMVVVLRSSSYFPHGEEARGEHCFFEQFQLFCCCAPYFFFFFCTRKAERRRWKMREKGGFPLLLFLKGSFFEYVFGEDLCVGRTWYHS